MDKHYVGSVGKTIILDCGLDISDATITEFRVLRPGDDVYVDGELIRAKSVVWEADKKTISGRTNYLGYITEESDLDVAGKYEIQAYIKSGTFELLGNTAYLVIQNIFD